MILRHSVSTMMKSLIFSLLFFSSLALQSVTAQHNANAQGCVIYKPASSGVPLYEEFVSITDFGTNIIVKTLSGENLRIFHGQNPVIVPYPSNKTATKEVADAALAKARALLPKSSRRWDSIAAAWASIPKTIKAVTPKPSVTSDVEPAKPQGESITTIEGRVYKNVVITSATPAYISVQHDDGVARLMLDKLPKELQKKYSYDPVKAGEYLRSEAIAEAEQARMERVAQEVAEFDKLSMYARGTVIQVLSEGVMFVGSGFAADPANNNNQAGANDKNFKGNTGRIFILCDSNGMIDGQKWSGRIWPSGTYRYESVGAGIKTISQWSTSRLEAIRELSK